MNSLLCSEVKRGFLSHSDEEDKKKKWRRWKSIYVMYFTMFLTALSEYPRAWFCALPRLREGLC